MPMTSHRETGSASAPEGDIAADELISVIVPAYNVERFVARTLRSVLAQTHRNIEVVVVDDGSTDRTAVVVQEIAAKDSRVRLLRSRNQGVSAARNLAIAESRGRLIAPVDADDIWHPDKLRRQLALLRAGPLVLGVVYCWSRGIDDDDRVILPSWNASMPRGNVLRDIVVSGIAGNGSTPLIRRRCIEATAGYDQTMSLNEDWKFYTELAGVCEFDRVPEFLVGYRLHDDSASMTNARAMETAINHTTAWIRRTWPDLPDHLFVERAYTIGIYLGFLAIRQREYGDALRYIWRAARARPWRVFTLGLLRLLLLLPLHMMGLRRYRFLFWRKPLFTEMPVR
jgi:glycosyltransferase involved in cell wall biosynthesis